VNITDFTLNEPDDDGDIGCSLSVEAHNPSKHDVRLLRTRVDFINKDGAMFASASGDQDVRVEPGESFSFDPRTQWLQARFCGLARDDITARVWAVIYRREFFRLGEVVIPSRDTEYAILSKEVKAEGIVSDLHILVGRTPADDDGDVQLHVRLGVSNMSDKSIEKILLKSELVDEDDSVVETDETSSAIEPNGSVLLEFSMWGLKKNALKHARMRFALSVFHPVHRMVCEKHSTPA
jgi:hypothetical protein